MPQPYAGHREARRQRGAPSLGGAPRCLLSKRVHEVVDAAGDVVAHLLEPVPRARIQVQLGPRKLLDPPLHPPRFCLARFLHPDYPTKPGTMKLGFKTKKASGGTCAPENAFAQIIGQNAELLDRLKWATEYSLLPNFPCE